MSILRTLIRNSPSVNPDREYLALTFSGNYVTGGDTCDLTPQTIKDPGAKGVLGPTNVPSVIPKPITSNCGGYYAEWSIGTTLANAKLIWYAPGGAQLAAAAYPAAITGGVVQLEVEF